MDNDERVDLTRRNLGTLLGAFGIAALAGCAGTANASPEELGTTTEALNGPTFLWLDNIASLRAAPGSNNATTSTAIAIVGGFSTWGDGGGGMFCWVNGTPNDDGGTIIVPAGQTTGYWQRIYSGPMDIRWFGAVPGDQSTNTPPTAFDVGGTHNDYKVGSLLQWTLATQSKCGDAIQKAIIAAHQKGGGQVFIPAGTWYIYGYLRLLDGVELVGAGRMSVLKSMSTSPPGRGTATEFFSADPRRRLVETLGMRSATSRSTAVFWRGASQAASISATTWLSTRRLGPRSLPSWTT